MSFPFRMPVGAPGAVATLVLLALLACGDGQGPTPPVDDPPPPVGGLGARPGAFSDTLFWASADVPDFEAYRIARTARGTLTGSTPDTTWVELGQNTAVGDTVWIDDDVSPGHLYLYSVRVEDQAGQLGERVSLPVRTSEPAQPALGFEPRRSLVRSGEPVRTSIWVAGARDLHGIILELRHGATRLECVPTSPLGDPTLALCLGPSEGPTDLVLSGVRGGPTIDGPTLLAELLLAPGSEPDSIFLAVRSLTREDGEPISGAEDVVLRSGYWEVAR